MKNMLLVTFVSLQHVLYAGTGNASDEGSFFLFLIITLGILVGILHLAEIIKTKITNIIDELISKYEY